MIDDTYTTSVHIAAPPATVFPYLVDSELIVRWMGNWADLQPEVGGKLALDINGIPIRGEFVVVDPPHRLVFTWGVPGNDDLAPGSTTVEIVLRAEGNGTVLELAHRDLPRDEVSRHDEGWGHFLARLEVVAAGGDPGPDPWVESE